MITNALFKPKSDMSASKVNTRIEQARRYICGGRVLQGGQVVFGEFASNGDLWFAIVHCDSISGGERQYYFDSIPVTLDGSGNVTTQDFMHKGKTYFRVFTHTYTEANPIPSFATELNAIFGAKWTAAEHMLVGTTYTVVHCKAIKIEDRYKVYRWRGALGLGEPNVALLSDWSNMYDPRDPTQVLGDRSTYKPSRNAALMWAWWRTHPYGRRKKESEVNWQRVAEQANICNQSIVGIETTQPRYECAIAASDDVDRSSIEQQIMMSCDGQLVFDDDGKSWMRVGYYYTPTLSLSRNRDIITMTSVEAQDGESETQGVVVRFIDPNAGYTLQASAPWWNPLWYKPGEGNTFLTVDIPTCPNHNQAMRLAKAIGLRSQPKQKIAPVTGLRGLRAMGERVVNINYDNTFAGDYEIATPVEVDESGMFCSIGMTPVGPNNWTLLPGEERSAPNSDDAYQGQILNSASNVVVGYNNGRIEATFDAPDRDDVIYEFEYIAQSQIDSEQWSKMSTDMEKLFAYSGSVNSNIPQAVRWTTVSSGGLRSVPSTPVIVGALPSSELSQAIYNSWIVERANGNQIMSIAADGTLTIVNHTRRYPDAVPDVAVTGAVIETGLEPGFGASIGYDDESRAGGVVTYTLFVNDNDAHVGPTHPYRHYVGYFVVPTTGMGGGGGGGIPGGSGGNPIP